jgi:hypothetical protein
VGLLIKACRTCVGGQQDWEQQKRGGAYAFCSAVMDDQLDGTVPSNWVFESDLHRSTHWGRCMPQEWIEVVSVGVCRLMVPRLSKTVCFCL